MKNQPIVILADESQKFTENKLYIVKDFTESQFLTRGKSGFWTVFVNITLGNQPRLQLETQVLGVCFEGGELMERSTTFPQREPIYPPQRRSVRAFPNRV